jgi:hypothetical protein
MARATLKLYCLFQSRDMNNIHCQRSFNHLVDIVEKHEGAVGLHWNVLNTPDTE